MSWGARGGLVSEYAGAGSPEEGCGNRTRGQRYCSGYDSGQNLSDTGQFDASSRIATGLKRQHRTDLDEPGQNLSNAGHKSALKRSCKEMGCWVMPR